MSSVISHPLSAFSIEQRSNSSSDAEFQSYDENSSILKLHTILKILGWWQRYLDICAIQCVEICTSTWSLLLSCLRLDEIINNQLVATRNKNIIDELRNTACEFVPALYDNWWRINSRRNAKLHYATEEKKNGLFNWRLSIIRVPWDTKRISMSLYWSKDSFVDHTLGSKCLNIVIFVILGHGWPAL